MIDDNELKQSVSNRDHQFIFRNGFTRTRQGGDQVHPSMPSPWQKLRGNGKILGRDAIAICEIDVNIRINGHECKFKSAYELIKAFHSCTGHCEKIYVRFPPHIRQHPAALHPHLSHCSMHDMWVVAMPFPIHLIPTSNRQYTESAPASFWKVFSI